VVQCDLKSHGITDYGELSRRGHHKANLGKPPPMDLFINGERMTLARWPNPADPPPAELNKHMEGLTGIVCRSAIVDKGPTMDDPDFLTRGGTFAYAFDRPSLWSRADDIWLDGVFAWSWEWSYNKIAAIDTAKKQITLRYGEVSGLQDKYSGNFFFAENLLEEIDLPGEYYIDRAAGRLYLLPPAGFANADTVITVSTLKTPVIEMKGASFITVQGFVLDTGRGGGISCNGGEGNRIDRCEVRNVTGSGVSVNGRNHGVVSCHIHHVGGAGVGLSGGNVDTLEPGGCFAENNHIHHVAWYSKVYTPAIGLGYRSVGNRVSHNKIHDTPHLAIVVYGNDHLIEYNEFYNVAMLFIDMGAIYGNLGATPCERGTVIRRNWFHDIGNVRPLQNGIYPDNNTMGWTIEENVFQRIGGPGATAQSRSIDVNAGAWIITRHNLFVDCSLPYMMNTYSASQEVYDRNKKTWTEYFKTHDLSKLPHARKYPELLRFWDEERQYADSNTFEGNLIYNPTVPLLKKFGKMDMVDGTVDAKKQLRRKDNWVTTEDPGFVDVAAGNLSLRADAPVFSRIPGFPVIPFKEIGLTGPVGPE
jgi:hypothetical protein